MFECEDIFCLAGIILLFLILFGVIAGVGAAIGYKSSCESARIYNNLHSTSYTCSDFFWAADQINKSTSTIHLAK